MYYHYRSPLHHRMRNKQRFIVDTSSDGFVFSRKLTLWLREHVNSDLFVVNTSTITTYGQMFLSLEFRLCHDFTWSFVMATSKSPKWVSNFSKILFSSTARTTTPLRNKVVYTSPGQKNGKAQPENRWKHTRRRTYKLNHLTEIQSAVRHKTLAHEGDCGCPNSLLNASSSSWVARNRQSRDHHVITQHSSALRSIRPAPTAGER